MENRTGLKLNFNSLVGIILILCLCDSGQSFGQEEKTEKGKTNLRLEYGVYFKPAAASRTSATSESYYQPDVDYEHKISTPIFGFSAGAFVGFGLSEVFRAELGVSYRLDGVYLDNLKSNQGPALETFWKKYGTLRNYQSVELPITFLYRSKQGRVKFICGIGGVTSIIVGANTWDVEVRQSGSESTRKNSNTSIRGNVSFAPVILAGADVGINHLFGIRIEPYFQHGVIDVTEGSRFQRYLWSAGVGIIGYLRH